MPLPLALAGLVSILAKNGLSMLGNAVLAKGKEVIEEKIGVKIPDTEEGFTSEKLGELAKAQMEHQEFLVEAAVKDTASARAMNTAISTSADASSLSKNIVPILALIVTVGGGLILSLHSETEVRITAGNLMMLVLGFYFGTSLGSVRANQLLRDQVTAKK